MIKEAYIKELCEQFGCSKSELLNILSQYEIGKTLVLIIIFGGLLILSIGAILLGIYINKKYGYKHDSAAFNLIFLGSIFSLISVLGCLLNIPDYVGFTKEPISAAMYFIDNHLSVIGF